MTNCCGRLKDGGKRGSKGRMKDEAESSLRAVILFRSPETLQNVFLLLFISHTHLRSHDGLKLGQAANWLSGSNYPIL